MFLSTYNTIHFIYFSHQWKGTPLPPSCRQDLLADPAVDAVGHPNFGPFGSDGAFLIMSEGKALLRTVTIWLSHVVIFSWSMLQLGLQRAAGRCALLLDRESHSGREARPE